MSKISKALAEEYASLKKDTDAKLARMKEISALFLQEHQETQAEHLDFDGVLKSAWFEKTTKKLDLAAVEAKFGIKITEDCYKFTTAKSHSMTVDRKLLLG